MRTERVTPSATCSSSAADLPVCPYRVALRHDWQNDRDGLIADLEKALGFPMFVKPANLGSSVGISKAKTREELAAAMDLAGEFDRKIVIEAAVPSAREIECAVLGNDTPEASVPGEVIPSREFYDYEAKYIDDASTVIIPADLAPTWALTASPSHRFIHSRVSPALQAASPQPRV